MIAFLSLGGNTFFATETSRAPLRHLPDFAARVFRETKMEKMPLSI
jgi:hypothetical protein